MRSKFQHVLSSSKKNSYLLVSAQDVGLARLLVAEIEGISIAFAKN